MPLYVKDPEVDRLAERLSMLTRVSKTEAVRSALRHELARVEPPSEFVARGLKFVRDLEARAPLKKGQLVDKAWIDSLYE